MAHFAELDENNTVLRVIVVNDSDCLDENGNESEIVGADFCTNLFGGRWVQASYNATIRKNYPGAGYTYDQELDAFIPPRPFPSWSMTEDCKWFAPVAYPSDENRYQWDEASLSWVVIPVPPEE